MATTGYASALGGLAKDAVIGAGKGFVGGLKGAMMSEAPGLTGAYAFAKELRSRANAPKMSSGGSAPPASNKSSSSSPMAGGLGTSNDKSIVGVLRQSNIINLEQVSQLKQLNANVINQSKLLKFTVDDTKRKDQFAEEVAKEQAFRDDALLDAIKRIGSSDKKQTKNNDKKESSFLGNLVDLISDNIGTLIAGYFGIKYGGKVLGAVGSRVLGGGGSRALGGIAGRATPLIGMAGRGAAAAADVIDVQARVISSTAARGALATGIRTVVPMVLSFLTSPIGLGIMAAAGIFALLKTASNPNYVPGTGKVGKSQVDNLGAKDSNKPLNQEDAKIFLEDANKRKTTKLFPTQTDEQFKKQQAEADRTLNEYGGRQRVENAAKGLPEYRTPGKGVVSSLKGLRDLGLGAGPKEHNGVDLSMSVGTPITPIAPGTVTAVDTDGKSGLGRFVTITHPDGTTSTYAHLKEVDVKSGAKVEFDTRLGRSGGDKKTDTGAGASTGPHLHLEVKRGGQFIDPATLSGLGALGEKDRAVEAGMYTSAKAAAAPPAKAATSAGTHDSMKPAGYNPGLVKGGAKLVPSIPVEKDFPALQKLAEKRLKEEKLNELIAKKNKIEEQLNKVLQGLDPKSPVPEPTEALANKLEDDIKEIDKKILLIREGTNPVAPKSTSANSKLEAEKKKIIDALEELKRTIIKGVDDYLKDIKNLKDKTGDSNSAVDSNFIAGYNLNSPLFAKQTNIQENPNAYVTAEHLFGIAKVTSDAGGRGGKAVIDLNAGDSAKDYDRFNKIENRRIDENIARIEDERKRVFLTAEKSSYTTAGVEVSKESNPLVAFIERLLVIFRGERSSSVKLDPYFDNMHVNDLFRKTERDFRVESDKLASGTKVAEKKEPVTVVAPATDALLKDGLGTGKGGTAVAKQTQLLSGGNLLKTQAPPPFKPNFRGNTQILAEANKQFLNELRSTFTGLARKGLQDALLPNGVGVSFAQASQDTLFRGEQLKQINDTSKKINEGAVKLFGNKFGPMFAPMLDKLSTSYFEVGSRLVGRQLFTRFGGLDDKETMGITGQVLGNIAAGKKQLAAEQLLFGMSGGRERGIALNVESLFAKYGFEDSQQGISYFADVLGEKATQPFSKVFGADDRNKSIVRDPRSGKLVYTDSGKEASKDDIKAGYGGRISQTPLLGKENEYMEVPGYPGSVAGTGGPPDQYAIFDAKGKIIGRKAGGMTNSSVTGGSFSAAASRGTGIAMQQYAQVPDGRGGMVNPTQADLLGMTPAQFNTNVKDNTVLAEGVKAQLQQNSRAEGIRHAEAIRAEAKIAADAAKISGDHALANRITAEADRKANEIVTIKGAEVVVDGVAQAVGGGKDGAASGSATPGLRASGRRPGQLFDANVYDKEGKIDGKDPMKEIGNFGFDILKLAAGSELTKGISNPYMQTITNFAIQKGMNYAIDSIMDSNIFSKMGSAASSSSSSYGGISDAFSWISNLLPFKDGGLVQRRTTGGPVTGAGTGTSDSIPAMLSNGEFVVNAAAYKANKALVNAINQSTLPKKNTSGSGTYVNDGGPMDPTPGLFDGMTKAQQAAYFDVNPFAAKINALVDTLIGFTTFGSIMNFFDPTGKNERAAIRGGFQTYSDFRDSMGAFANAKTDAAKFSGLTGKTARESELNAEKADQAAQQNSTGKNSWGKSGDANQDIGGIDPSGGFSGKDSNGGFAPSTSGEMAKGGLVTGKGSGTSDSIFSMLSNGEFVINAKATKANLALLKQINSYSGSGSVPKSEYDSNLSIEPFKNTFKGFAAGGLVATANKSSTMNAVPRPTSRSPYILSPPTNNSSSENQNNSSNMIIGPKTSTRIDNSSVTNFYNQASGMIDSIRSITPQVA